MRDWWLRTLLVVQAPRAVFVALRNDDPEDIAARSEPVLLIVMLAGIAFVLSTRTASHLMDDHDYDGLVVAVWAFLAGSLYGGIAYWFLGGLLHGSVTAFGSAGTYRRTRQVLAFALVPVALSLILWPVKLALYRGDLFHAGGADSGTGGKVLQALGFAFAAWAACLLVIGVRAVHGWAWPRSIAAAVVPVAVGAALTYL